MVVDTRIPAWDAMKFWRHLDGRGRLLASALLLLFLSLLEPRAQLPSRVYDWYFVIDITQSMNVRDAVTSGNGISRLAFAKQQMRQALRSLPCGSRVSLGLFTERSTANILHPLEVCAHFAALDETIASIDWRMAWAADSYIANGVFSAIDQASRLGPEMRLAFFTDGNQAPEISARYAPVFEGEQGKVRGIVFGLGSQAAGRIPLLDQNDNITGYWGADDVQRYATFGISEIQSVADMEQQQGYHGRNAPHGSAPKESANAHLSALDQNNLQKIAKDTGLTYRELTKDKEIGRVVTSNEMSVWRTAVSDLRPWLVLPAMWLILIFYIPASLHQLFQQHLSFRKKS
jgi:mxaL protein